MQSRYADDESASGHCPTLTAGWTSMTICGKQKIGLHSDEFDGYQSAMAPIREEIHHDQNTLEVILFPFQKLE